MKNALPPEHSDPVGGASTRALCLRLVDGPLAGSRWALGPRILLIGRGMGCQIRLDDPAISRQHCEVAAPEDAGIHLCHLGERTETYVNGEAVAQTALALGDEIRVGGYHLLVDQLSPSEVESSGEDTAGQRTRTPSMGLRKLAARTLEEDFSQASLEWPLALLAHLPNSASLDDMATRASDSLARSFAAERVWVARYLTRAEQVVLHPPPTRDKTHTIPLRLIGEACRTQEAISVDLPDQSGWTVAVAPLVLDGQAIGAIGIRVPLTPQHERLKNKLELAARWLAPMLRTVERVERLSTEQRSRGALGVGHREKFLGNSKNTCDFRDRVRRLAQARASVLIMGETGTGKEIIARTVHDLSPRAEGPFIAVNCAAIPDDLFESEIFGHERGAFTGAIARRQGLLQQAHGGTLFLDEVGELSLANQARLLRAIDTGCFRPIGATKEVQVDTRIVSATNRTLPDPAHAYFRQDLYHRLATMTLNVLPLRERATDIPMLAQHFLDNVWAESPSRPRSFSGEAMSALCAYSWPGNVRELRNVVERAFFESQGNVISESDLGLPHKSEQLEACPGIRPLEELERDHLLATLQGCNWKIATAANVLGVSRGTVYYKMARLGVRKTKSDG